MGKTLDKNCIQLQSHIPVLLVQNDRIFYKEKATNIQVVHGPYKEGADQAQAGWFDFIGNDRKLVLFLNMKYCFNQHDYWYLPSFVQYAL